MNVPSNMLIITATTIRVYLQVLEFSIDKEKQKEALQGLAKLADTLETLADTNENEGV